MLDTEDVSRPTFARVAVYCSVSRRTLRAYWDCVPDLLYGNFLHLVEPMLVWPGEGNRSARRRSSTLIRTCS